jgi:formylglycine-generating enzyme required for sulfatase activity
MKPRILIVILFALTVMLYPQSEEKKSTSPEMIKVEGGTFMMGATSEQGNQAQSDEKPAHKVTVSSFLIGKTELTVGEFKEFIISTGYKTTADVYGGSYVWYGGDDFRKVSGVNWSCDTKGEKRPSTEMNHPVSI